MENPRSDKVAVVDEVKDRLESSSAAILTEYRGLTVKEIATLRRSLTAAGGDYKIYKNTLVRFAVRDKGIEGLEELLVGPTAIAFVDGDAAAVAKALRDFARTNPNLVVKGGLLGTGVLSAAETTALAELPSREVLLAQLAGAIAAPMQQFAGLLQALPRNMAYGLKALIDKGGGVPETATAETTAETTSEATSETGDVPAATPGEAPTPDQPIETEPPNPTRDNEPEPAPDTETPNETPTEEQ